MTLVYRIASSIVLIPLIFIFVYLGGWPFFALGVLATAIATNEFCAILRRAGYRPLQVLTLFLSLAFIFDAQMMVSGASLPGGTALARFALSLTVIAALVWQLLREEDTQLALTGWAFLFAGALYIGWLLRYYLLLRGLEAGVVAFSLELPVGAGLALTVDRGALWISLVLVTTWVCDTTAFFAGSSFGKRRLMPRISPKKTWEGTIAGVVAAGLFTTLAGQGMGLTPALGAGLGLSIGVAAVMGDLAESLIKRGGHVKDAGTLIPGHGGLLDRLDSMLFTGVTAYYYLALTQAVQI